MFIDIQTLEYPLFMDAIRKNHKDATFDNFPERYQIVADGVVPDYDSISQALIEEAPVEIDGVWTKTYKVINLTPAEIIERVDVVLPLPFDAVENGGDKIYVRNPQTYLWEEIQGE